MIKLMMQENVVPIDPIVVIATIVAFVILGAILVLPIFGSVSSIVIFIAILVNWNALAIDEMLLLLFITLMISLGVNSVGFDLMFSSWKKYYLIHLASLLLPASLLAWRIWEQPFVVILIVGVVSVFGVLMTFDKIPLKRK